MQSYFRVYELPWSHSATEERLFRAILRNIGIALIVLAVVIPFLPVPEEDPDKLREIPQRFAKLILEQPKPPPPPPVIEEPEPEELEPEPEPEKVVEKEPEPEPEPTPEPEPEPVDLVAEARETAAQMGVMEFADELADLVDDDIIDNGNDAQTAAVTGPGTRNERSLITSSLGSGSGGINTANMSRNTGGQQLALRKTTKVKSPVDDVARQARVQRQGRSDKGSRSREEIELVFDRNKGAIYALYNRALRKDPTLQGKLVLRLTIAPSGAVTDCEIVSSELNSPELERKLVAKVRMFRFESKDVEAITTTKPIDFFPA